SNGSLHNILRNQKYHFDDNFKFCLALDVVAGMSYLHQDDIIHGYLTTNSCCVDEKWNVKIADWCFYKLAQKQDDADDANQAAKRAFWLAPEMIKNPNQWPTKEADVYSFSILLIEIFTQEDPYSHLTDCSDPSDVLLDITTRGIRPAYPHAASHELMQIFNMCWVEDPTSRPTFKKLKKLVEKAKPSKKGVLDCLMEALE
ncbi:hypothetical protein CAPTEDRAFT_78649, partial [Capitella teleta]